MVLLLFYASISIVFSFLCSIWEAVLLSITPSFVNRELQAGTSLGASLQEFKEDIDRPLSAILTLNTIAHTVGAILVGKRAAEIFDTGFSFLSIPMETIVAILMTLAILLLSEIIPKTLGANNWRNLAGFTVKSLKFIIFILTPFIWMSMQITKRLKSKDVKSVLSRADFLAMANLGKQSGALKENESAIIENLLHLNKLKAKDIMTPRTMITMADQNMTLGEFYESHNKMPPFSRIPIYNENRDHITGLILKTEVLGGMLEGRAEEKLESIKRPLVFVNDNKELGQLFEFLSRNKSHISAVTDEYGSVIGLVSLEDLFETILGFEIMDESDNIADLQQFARKKWKERAKKMGLLVEPENDGGEEQPL